MFFKNILTPIVEWFNNCINSNRLQFLHKSCFTGSNSSYNIKLVVIKFFTIISLTITVIIFFKFTKIGNRDLFTWTITLLNSTMKFFNRYIFKVNNFCESWFKHTKFMLEFINSVVYIIVFNILS